MATLQLCWPNRPFYFVAVVFFFLYFSRRLSLGSLGRSLPNFATSSIVLKYQSKIKSGAFPDNWRPKGIKISALFQLILRLDPESNRISSKWNGKRRCKLRSLQHMYIGVGAQSTLGARHFCPKNMFKKINKMPEFYMILALKISKEPEVL